VLKAVGYDLDNTVFSYIPNTAESAFYGLIKGVEDYLNQSKIEKILKAGEPYERKLAEIINHRPRWKKSRSRMSSSGHLLQKTLPG